MNDYIAKRAVAAGEYLVLAKATVRQTAKKFGVSKSTVHKDVSERLVEIDRSCTIRNGTSSIPFTNSR